jgi:hypothetical protein
LECKYRSKPLILRTKTKVKKISIDYLELLPGTWNGEC